MEQNVESLDKLRVPALDEILGKKFPVLDDGFIRLIDYMGSDESIVQAARVSYGKGTKKVSEDRGLIRYLMRHHHTTPFEMCEIKLHVRVPMDTWRQWIRHRTANVNEYSTRYSIAIDATQKTNIGEWRLQAKDNKQGSEGFFPDEIGSKLSEREKETHKFLREKFESAKWFIASLQQRRNTLMSPLCWTASNGWEKASSFPPARKHTAV